jgi:ADYC domain
MRSTMSCSFRLVIMTFIAAAALAEAAAEPETVAIKASGTAFRVTFADGAVRRGTDLAGTVLMLKVAGTTARIRIVSVVPDAEDKTGAVLLHDFRIEESGASLCEPDADGKRFGFPLAGRTAADGGLLAEDDAYEVVCTSGAQGKCVRFGYHPWENGPHGESMRDYYNACVRLVRADYCGDGQTWTREGALIDLWDNIGIRRSTTLKNSMFSFEAGWTSGGSVCVAHTRVPEKLTPDSLKISCPRLAHVPICNEKAARRAGALLFNRSR